MIFCSKNEEGTPAWELVLSGDKKVTRRAKPQPVGAIRAVQPNRGKEAVGYIKITDCRKHSDCFPSGMGAVMEEKEARREGFNTWEGLMQWFRDKKIDINNTYRIGFQLVEAKE